MTEMKKEEETEILIGGFEQDESRPMGVLSWRYYSVFRTFLTQEILLLSSRQAKQRWNKDVRKQAPFCYSKVSLNQAHIVHGELSQQRSILEWHKIVLQSWQRGFYRSLLISGMPKVGWFQWLRRWDQATQVISISNPKLRYGRRKKAI